ncbi:hypothetical protein Vafri_17088, partial [Volvox africanus]
SAFLRPQLIIIFFIYPYQYIPSGLTLSTSYSHAAALSCCSRDCSLKCCRDANDCSRSSCARANEAACSSPPSAAPRAPSSNSARTFSSRATLRPAPRPVAVAPPTALASANVTSPGQPEMKPITTAAAKLSPHPTVSNTSTYVNNPDPQG